MKLIDRLLQKDRVKIAVKTLQGREVKYDVPPERLKKAGRQEITTYLRSLILGEFYRDHKSPFTIEASYKHQYIKLGVGNLLLS